MGIIIFIFERLFLQLKALKLILAISILSVVTLGFAQTLMQVPTLMQAPSSIVQKNANGIVLSYNAQVLQYTVAQGWTVNQQASQFSWQPPYDQTPHIQNSSVYVDEQILQYLGLNLPRLNNIRFSTSERFRIVFDLDERIIIDNFSAEGTITAARPLELNMPSLAVPWGLTEQIEDVSIQLVSELDKTRIKFSSQQERPYRVYSLSEPRRLVLDFEGQAQQEVAQQVVAQPAYVATQGIQTQANQTQGIQAQANQTQGIQTQANQTPQATPQVPIAAQAPAPIAPPPLQPAQVVAPVQPAAVPAPVSSVQPQLPSVQIGVAQQQQLSQQQGIGVAQQPVSPSQVATTPPITSPTIPATAPPLNTGTPGNSVISTVINTTPTSTEATATGIGQSLNSFLENASDIAAAAEQTFKDKSPLDKVLASGVRYRRFPFSTAVGQSIVHVVEISPGYGEFRVVGSLTTPRTISELSNGAFIGINAGYFDPRTHTSIGLLKIAGSELAEPTRNRASVAFGPGVTEINRVSTQVTVSSQGRTVPITGYNAPAKTTVYTMPNARVGVPGQGVITVKDNRVIENKIGPRTVPFDGYAIVYDADMNDPYFRSLAMLNTGDTIQAQFEANPKQLLALPYAVEAGPLLVENGQSAYNPGFENFENAYILNGRTHQAAIGARADGTVLLVAAEAMVAKELIPLFTFLGADKAMRLDSGSSTQLFVDGKVINKRSERRVVSGIVYLPN